MRVLESRTRAAARAAITVARVTDASAFAALREEWDALFARSFCRSVFLRFAWLEAWWAAFGEGHELRILMARDQTGRLVGIAPLYVRHETSPWGLRVLTFLGTERVSSDYLDFLVQPDLEEAVARALWDAIAASAADVDWIRWCDILDSSVVSRRVVPAARASGWMVEERRAEYCPYVVLPATLDALLAERGKSLRDHFRRATRKLEGVGVVFETLEDPGRIPEALETFYRLHEARWRGKGQEGNFRDPRVRAFHMRVGVSLAATGALRLHRLRLGDRTLGILYALDDRGIVSYYQTGFDPESPDPSVKPHDYSPGTVLIGKVIDDAIRRGRSEFDFLRGHEPAKFRWTGSYRITRTVIVVPRGRWSGLSALAATAANRGARSLARRLLRLPGLPPPPGASR